MNEEFQLKTESMSDEERQKFDQNYGWIKQEQEKRQKVKELQEQNYENIKQFYLNLFSSYEKKEYYFTQSEFEKRLIEEFKTGGEEICNNNLDDNANEQVDCAESQCSGKICGRGTKIITKENSTETEEVDFYCIQNTCQAKEEIITEKLPVCGNHICEEKEADIILWDGGNNDMSFYRSDLTFVVVDPHRPGHELKYYPGNTALRMADVAVINKMDSAHPLNVENVKSNIKTVNPKAVVIEADSPVTVDNPELIKGKRVLVVEDGPTLTHGEMKYGAGTVIANNLGASTIVDPRPYTVGLITETFKKYPNIGSILPAMGYGADQIRDLETTINKTDCDSVLIGTPIDLSRIIKINKPFARASYNLAERGDLDVRSVLNDKKLL